MREYRCPSCGGDGKETCHNPDHGFLRAMSGVFLNANESACPCCGHDEERKIKKYINGKWIYNECYECNGLGKVSEFRCETILDEYAIDRPLEDFFIHD